MIGDRYRLHHRSEVQVDADAHGLFAHLDDHRRLASHMEKPSLMMAGATMRVEVDALREPIGIRGLRRALLGRDRERWPRLDDLGGGRLPPMSGLRRAGCAKGWL